MTIIRVIIKGYLKNTMNEEIIIDTFGIKAKNKIKYLDNNINNTILISLDQVVLLRENQEFKNSLIFKKNKTTISEYLVKDNNINLEIKISTTDLKIEDDYIKVNYLVEDSNIEYEYMIKVGVK